MVVSLTKSSQDLVLISCFCTFAAVVLNAVAFGTRHWLDGPGVEKSPFISVGFHEACFEGCMNPYCPGGDLSFVYHGCSWIHSEYFKELYWWLKPDWYMHVRGLSIVTVPWTFIVFLFTAVCTCIVISGHCCRVTQRRDALLIVLLYISTVVVLSAGILIMVVLAMFSYHAFQYDWMPMPEKNSFGYSFWLDLCATILLFLASFGLLLAAVFKTLIWHRPKLDPGVAEDMMLGRT